MGAGGRGVAAGRRPRPRNGPRRAGRQATGLLRRSVAGRTRPALRLLDGRYGVAVLPAAGYPVVHIHQHRSRYLGKAGPRRGGEHERSETSSIKAQGAPAALLSIYNTRI